MVYIHYSQMLLNIGSIWGSLARSHRTLYSSAKAGIAGMTRAMAVEFASDHVLVNCLSPGFVDTDLTRASLTSEEIAEQERKIPLGRLAQPAEIAEVTSYLCGSGNSYLTGQEILVDGGFSIV